MYPLWIAAHEGPRYGIAAATIRQWARRGRLLSRGLDNNGRPLYSMGEILTLAGRSGQQAA